MADVRARSRGRVVRRVDRGDMVLARVGDSCYIVKRECVCDYLKHQAI